jgi:hypothetical protein
MMIAADIQEAEESETRFVEYLDALIPVLTHPA